MWQNGRAVPLFFLFDGGFIFFYLVILRFYFPSTLQQHILVSPESLEIRSVHKEYSVSFAQVFESKGEGKEKVGRGT